MINAISVLMPVYNSANFLQSSIDSILNQTFKNFEFLIIDDGSTDNSKEVIERYNDSRIRYIQNNHHGLSKTLNYGLKIAKYDWIARMDADDIAVPNRLSIQVDYLKYKGENNIVSSWYVLFKHNKVSGLIKTPIYNDDITQALLLHNVICHPGVMYNRKIIIANGGYSDIPVEDYDLWLRIKNNIEFYIIPKPLILLRENSQSLTRTNIYSTNISVQKIHNLHCKSFNQRFLSDISKKLLILGWREFFYGDKRKARNYWRKIIVSGEMNFKISLAFLSTFLPELIFIKLKDKRIHSRIDLYLFCSIKTRKKIKKLVSSRVKD